MVSREVWDCRYWTQFHAEPKYFCDLYIYVSSLSFEKADLSLGKLHAAASWSGNIKESNCQSWVDGFICFELILKVPTGRFLGLARTI